MRPPNPARSSCACRRADRSPAGRRSSSSASRAIPGVEVFDGERVPPHARAAARARRRRARARVESYVRAELSLADWRDLAPAVQRLRRLLDLDADPIAVDAVLGDDPVLEPFVAKTPGRRAPGAVDPFEIAVRGVVGQQVSVAGARTVTARIVEAAGDVLTVPTTGSRTCSRRPTDSPRSIPTTLPMPRARGRTLTGLAAAVADGSIALDTGADREELVQRLVALPGIGPWTARYTVMRGLGDPDVFLDTDLGVRHALDRLGIDADASPSGGDRGARTPSIISGPPCEGDHHERDHHDQHDDDESYRTTMPSPVGELTLVADDTALRRSVPRRGAPAADSVADVGGDVIDVAAGDHPVLALADAPARGVLRRHRHRVRRPARARRHSVPAAGVVGAAVDPVRRDDELRRAGRRARRSAAGAGRRCGERAQPDPDHRAVPPRRRLRTGT